MSTARAWIPVAALAACTSTPRDPHRDDTPTYGSAWVLADEAFRSVLEDERTMFNAIYTDAQVTIGYLPERDLLRAMGSDSVRAVFATVVPGAEQQAYFRTRNLSPHVEPVLTDAIAMMVSARCPLDSVDLERVRTLLGTPAADGNGYFGLFDDKATGVARTLVDSLFAGDASRLTNARALPGLDSLLAHVARDPKAIGFVPFAAISDLDDAQHRARRGGLKVLAVSALPGGRAIAPSQSTLADGQYPLRRNLYMMVVEGKSGLGTGFASFVAGHKGQRIILKRGLAPAHVPAREVMIVNE